MAHGSMMKLRYGVSYWLDTFPKSRVPAYPRYRGALNVDVAIVGGGLTGCATAYALAAAGAHVALFESERIGTAGTAGANGLVLQDPGIAYRDVERLHGIRSARRIFQAVHRSALDLSSTLRRLRIECGAAPRDLVQLALVADDDKLLQREWQDRKRAGLDASLVKARQARERLKVERYGALQTRDHARVDPYRASLGFARAAAGRGAKLFERSPVRQVRFGRTSVDLKTDGGHVTASAVVVATERATELFRPLKRHFKTFHRYHVVTPPLPAALRRECGPETVAITDTASPPHWLHWLRDSRIVWSGGDQPQVAQRAAEKALVQRTGQLMYELSTLYPAISGVMPEYAWSGAYGRTADGLPYLGLHRNYPHHLFALGCGIGGPALAFLASRILLRRYLGKPATGDEIFDFSRTRN